MNAAGRTDIKVFHQRSAAAWSPRAAACSPERTSGRASVGAASRAQRELRLGDVALAGGVGLERELAVVVGDPRGERAAAALLELLGDGDGGAPVARALVQVEQGEPRFGVERRSGERLVGLLGAIEEAGLHVVLRQAVLGLVALGLREIGAAEQVLVDAHRALVLAALSEQVAEREVELGGVRVLLDGFDEGVDRLVVLLVEEQVQALVVDLGRLLALAPVLARVEARGEPAEHEAAAAEAERQPEQPLRVKVHRAADGAGRARRRRAARASAGAVLGAARVRSRHAAVPPPARHHREDAERAAEAERGEDDEDHRRAPLVAEEPVHARRVLVVQREREQREEDGGPDEPDERSHRPPDASSRPCRLGAAASAASAAARSGADALVDRLAQAPCPA